MFKNSVFSVNTNTKDWFKKAGVRAIKTMAQTMLSLFTIGQAICDVDWKMVISVTIVSGIYSLATSIVGIPEVETE